MRTVHPLTSLIRVSCMLLGAAVALLDWNAASAAARAGATRGTRSSRPATSAHTRKALARVARSAPGTAGMVMAIDPVTGRLRMPSPEQLDRLSPAEENAMSRSDVGLVQRVLPNGTVYIDLQGRNQDMMLVSIGPGGKKSFNCVTDADAANEFFRATSVAPKKLAER